MDVGMLPTARLPRSFASIIWTLHFKWPVNGQALISNQNSRCADDQCGSAMLFQPASAICFWVCLNKSVWERRTSHSTGLLGHKAFRQPLPWRKCFGTTLISSLLQFPFSEFLWIVNPCSAASVNPCSAAKKITEKVTMAYDSYDIDTLLSRHGAKREGCWDLNFVRLISAPKDSNAFLLSIYHYYLFLFSLACGVFFVETFCS